MRTASVRIDAETEPHVGAVVFGDDTARMIGKILGRKGFQAFEVLGIVFDLFQIRFVMGAAESVRRIQLRSSSFGSGLVGVRHDTLMEQNEVRQWRFQGIVYICELTQAIRLPML